LLLVFGIAFVVALNLAVRLDHSPVLVPDLDTATIGDVQFRQVRGPGAAVNGLELEQISINVLLKEAEDQINSDNLNRLQTWSILSVIALALASGAGGYVLSGMMLRPVRDITQVASEISASNLSQRINHEGPDDELKQLADTFDSMIERLESAFEGQRRFVQDASHELRTPLAAIRMNIEVTEMDPDVSPEDYRSLLETVKNQTERLTRLSDDLLLLTTHEGDVPGLESVSLRQVASEVISQLSPLAGQRNISLEVDDSADVSATANGDLLYRCVTNLVDNAIKYSGEGTSVHIGWQRDGEGAAIRVRDNGPGIPPEQRAHIFNRFYRIDRGRSRREGGSGLGLSIVRELTEAMGGSVSVTSAEGGGSTFTIRLPAA
jgi:signal transduction histidine kinase